MKGPQSHRCRDAQRICSVQKWKAPDAAPALSIGREIMRKGKKKRKILTFVCGGGRMTKVWCEGFINLYVRHYNAGM